MVSNHKQLLQIWLVTINRISLYALLALMVEQRFCKPKVVGSSPARGSSREVKYNPRRFLIWGRMFQGWRLTFARLMGEFDSLRFHNRLIVES